MFTVALMMVGSYGETDGQTRAPRRGVVRGDGRAFVDDGGPFLARGSSLFWALWAYQHDRERLGRNLATLRDWGFDYIRVLGVVGAPGDRPGPVCGPGVEGCDSWRDRRLDPGAADYAQNVAGLTDWAYREYGLRVQWSIFGGAEFTPTSGERRAVIERFAEMSKGREQAIFAFEVANEAFQNGFSGPAGREELRTLARALKAKSPNLVALSSPAGSTCAAAQELYRDSVADLMTVHISRAGEKDGKNWDALREVWDVRSCQGVPTLVSSNEPIGPQSSIVGLDDPVALTAMALVTYGSGIGAFVFHSGPGVRGGGAADAALGRYRNLWELPTGSRIASGLATIVKLVPGDFANWTNHDVVGDAPDPPFGAADKTAYAGLYCSSKGAEFACGVVGIRRPVSLITRRNMTATVHGITDGKAREAQRLAVGAALNLPAAPAAALIRGRFE
jgi:hypothetical protein